MMLYVKEGQCEGMFFVCQDTDTAVDGFQIVRVFFSEDKAIKYINQFQRIGGR